MSAVQYCQIRLEDAIALYREGNLTAAGLLKLYIKIKFAPGWQIGLIPEQVCQVLGIAKATFYKALAKVKEQSSLKQIKIINKIVLGDEQGTSTNEPKNPQSTTVERDSTTIESESTTVESESTRVESESTRVEDESSKAFDTNEHSDSPDLYSDSYSKFISNLSQDEREKFLDFCKKRTDSFDIPLKCGLTTFLAAKNKKTDTPYFAEFWELYQKDGDVVCRRTSEGHTTEMKPDFQKWYYWMKELGIMVKKYDWRGEVGAIDNCGADKSFEEWLKVYSMEEAKQRYETSRGWGR